MFCKRIKTIRIFILIDLKQTKDFICNYRPDVVVHCAAYTAVDRAEDEREICYAINVQGTKHVAMVCQEIGAMLVYVSTDYVFNGTGDEPFEIDQMPEPINYYGLTKYEGELEIKKLLEKYFIIRISWAFGINGNNFVKTMLRLGKEREVLNVVSDQIGSPTYTYDIAKLILQVISTDKYGIYFGVRHQKQRRGTKPSVYAGLGRRYYEKCQTPNTTDTTRTSVIQCISGFDELESL